MKYIMKIGLLRTLGSSLYGNMLSGKSVVRVSNWAIRSGQYFQFHFTLWLIWNKKYYQNEPKLKAAYSWNYLPKTVKIWAYIINHCEYTSIGIH